MAAIAGLEALNRPARSNSIQIPSISSTLLTSTGSRVGSKGLETRQNEEVKNVDLWKRLLAAKGTPSDFVFLGEGHNGHPENERCDFLATSAADGDELMVDPGV